jgi:hypothetical protein
MAWSNGWLFHQDRLVATKSGDLLSSKLDAKLTPQWLWIARLQA